MALVGIDGVPIGACVMAMGLMAIGLMACATVAANWTAVPPVEVLVPAQRPKFAIGIVVPAGPIDGGAWHDGDAYGGGPIPFILKALKNPTITRSNADGTPTSEGVLLGTVLVTLTRFDSIKTLPEAMRLAAGSLNEQSPTHNPSVGPASPNLSPTRRAYRHLLVIVDRWTDDPATLWTIRAARNELIGRPSDAEPPVHGRGSIEQINALVVVVASDDSKPAPMNRAMRHTADYFGFGAATPFPCIGPADYRHTLSPIWKEPQSSPGSCIPPPPFPEYLSQVVRNQILHTGSNPFIDQFNTIALIRQDTGQVPTRQEVKDTLADSFLTFTPVGTGTDAESNIAMVGDVAPPSGNPVGPWLYVDTNFHPTLSKYEWTLQQMFKRMTVCPSDFNRNGTTQGPYLNGVDAIAFKDAYGLLDLYADWNFDGIYPGIDPGFHGDAAKFARSIDPNTNGCPE
jgi:hypothetical protein